MLFDDTDVTSTVKAVKPDILVKGEEYKSQKVPGADFVATYGGAVHFAPMIPSVSSTLFDPSTA